VISGSAAIAGMAAMNRKHKHSSNAQYFRPPSIFTPIEVSRFGVFTPSVLFDGLWKSQDVAGK
jgi:hypothetical protein